MINNALLKPSPKLAAMPLPRLLQIAARKFRTDLVTCLFPPSKGHHLECGRQFAVQRQIVQRRNQQLMSQIPSGTKNHERARLGAQASQEFVPKWIVRSDVGRHGLIQRRVIDPE